jgi:hypothetical protein
MSQIQVTKKASTKWFVLSAVLLSIVGAFAWWSHEPASSGAVTTATQTSEAAKPPATDGLASIPLTPDQIHAQTQEMVAKQLAAAKEIEREPGLAPIKGPITQRPSFVSEMEWTMLQGVAQQHAAPDKELTRLVNFLRFTKQMELWEGLPKSEDPAKRQALAAALLDDLPQRVANGEIDLKTAQTTQTALLADAVSDPQARKQRAATEGQRLQQASAGSSSR